MSRGFGSAHGAISVLNAIATGIGGAVGIELPIHSEIRLREEHVVTARSTVKGCRVPVDAGVLEAVLRTVEKRLGYRGGFHAEISSDIPVAAGLKSSHALVNSLLAGILDALGLQLNIEELALLGVEASMMAGLTITGAYDDSLATLGRGVYITDNAERRVLRHYRIDRGLYAVVLVPPTAKPIWKVDPSDFQRLSECYMGAAKLALKGDWAAAMAMNGLLTATATGQDVAPLREALELPGVVSAGVSGKGPAFFAVTDDPEPVERLWSGLRGELIVARILG